MARVLKTLRNHWKKSTFGACLLAYGAYYTKDRYERFNIMQHFAAEALKYGQEPLSDGVQPRHVTVLLNPVANKGKAVKNYEKYCAPLLHLAGIKVSVVRTESQQQAKKYMEVMENTDAVIIAGGDGIISDAVTGILRRNDAETAIKRFPLGVLPLGRHNTLANALFKDHSHFVKQMADATMAVIREKYNQPADVMMIQPLEKDGSPKGQPVYALNQIEWGAYGDAYGRRDKYWYWGKLRSYVAFVFCSFQNLSWECEAEYDFATPCWGCNKCSPVVWQPRRWWDVFGLSVNHAGPTENPSCEWKTSNTLKTTQLTITTRNIHSTMEDTKQLDVAISEDSVGILDFITKGWDKVNGKQLPYVDKIEARELKLLPTETEERKIYIDNEEFSLEPMHVKLRPKLIAFYCNEQV